MFRMFTIVQFWLFCVPTVLSGSNIPITSAYQFFFWVDGLKIYQSEVEHSLGFQLISSRRCLGTRLAKHARMFDRAHIVLIAERQTS